MEKNQYILPTCWGNWHSSSAVVVSHTANSYDIPRVCEKLTHQKFHTKSLCRSCVGGGWGKDTRVTKWQSKKWTNYSSLWWMVDNCGLFTALDCCSNFWGYSGQTCVTVPDCVCNCWLGERSRRVKVQRTPPPLSLYGSGQSLPNLSSFLHSCNWPANQRWWPRPHARLTGHYALTTQNCFLIKWASTCCHQVSNLWF